MDLTNWVSSLASVAVAIGVIFVWWQAQLLRKQIEQASQQLKLSNDTLKADHDRSRKEGAVNLLREWVRDIKPESSSADKLVCKWSKEQCRNLVANVRVKIKTEQKHLAEACLNKCLKNPCTHEDELVELDETEVTRIRYYAVSYINLVEITLAAWQLHTVDRETIENQLRFLYRPEEGYNALENLRKAFRPHSFPATEEFVQHLKNGIESEAPRSQDKIA